MSHRIFARWIDDPLESPITLDAQLNAAHRIIGHWLLFGATGLRTPQSRPFTLDVDGCMDFGEGRAASDRCWQTDIRARELTIGATFSVTWSGGESGMYRIEKIYEPGSKTA